MLLELGESCSHERGQPQRSCDLERTRPQSELCQGTGQVTGRNISCGLFLPPSSSWHFSILQTRGQGPLGDGVHWDLSWGKEQSRDGRKWIWLAHHLTWLKMLPVTVYKCFLFCLYLARLHMFCLPSSEHTHTHTLSRQFSFIYFHCWIQNG